MRRRPTTALAACAAAAALWAGCGESSEERAGDTVIDYYAAVEAKRGQEACAQLTPEFRRELQREFARRGSRASCASYISNPPGASTVRSGTEVTDVSVEGERATVTIDRDGFRARAALRRSGDEWKIAGIERVGPG